MSKKIQSFYVLKFSSNRIRNANYKIDIDKDGHEYYNETYGKWHQKIKQKKIGSMFINDYSECLPSILDVMRPYTINYTQQEAGFMAETKEEILEVEMKGSTYKLINKLKKELVVKSYTIIKLPLPLLNFSSAKS